MDRNNNPLNIVMSVEYFNQLLELARSAENIISGGEGEDPTRSIRRHVRRYNPAYRDLVLESVAAEKALMKENRRKAKALLNHQASHPGHIFYVSNEEGYAYPIKKLSFDKYYPCWVRCDSFNGQDCGGLADVNLIMVDLRLEPDPNGLEGHFEEITAGADKGAFIRRQATNPLEEKIP